MFNPSPETYVAFFSANAQIFGALLGLYGLAYVRIAETIEQNVGQMVRSLMIDFGKALKGTQVDNLEVSVSLEDFGQTLKQFKEHLGASYTIFLNRHSEILKETYLRKELRQKFRMNCWLALALIFMSLVGILLPHADYPLFAEAFAAAILLVIAIALNLAVNFYLLVAETKMILTSHADS